MKPSVLGFSLSAGTSPVLAFAVSAEPACPEVIISASYSRGKTTFLFSFANKHLSPSGSSIMLQGEKCPWSSDLSNFSNYLYQECNIPSRQPDRHPMSLSIFLLRQLLWATETSGKLQLSWPGVEETIMQSLLGSCKRAWGCWGLGKLNQDSKARAQQWVSVPWGCVRSPQQLERMLIAFIRTTLGGALPAGGWYQWLFRTRSSDLVLLSVRIVIGG